MLQTNCIGYIGGDAEVKCVDFREFTTFRVAHSDKWTDAAGQVHESTQWIDCVMDGKPKVLEYLRKGTLVYVSGYLKTRVYSSAKDRCMKAGITINVRNLELLGGKADAIPSKVVDERGQIHDVTKWYYCADFVRKESEPEYIQVMNTHSATPYLVDRAGFVYECQTQPSESNDSDK